MFFLTFLPQFVDAGDPHAAGKLLFLGVLFVVICTPICALMVASASRIAGWLHRSPRLMRSVDFAFAGVFGAFALRLLFARGSEGAHSGLILADSVKGACRYLQSVRNGGKTLVTCEEAGSGREANGCKKVSIHVA
jgi:hypothetical protein